MNRDQCQKMCDTLNEAEAVLETDLWNQPLGAEKQLSGALCKLAFMSDQNPGHLKEVNRALTIRRKLKGVAR